MKPPGIMTDFQGATVGHDEAWYVVGQGRVTSSQ
jgi:hypothetical protein